MDAKGKTHTILAGAEAMVPGPVSFDLGDGKTLEIDAPAGGGGRGLQLKADAKCPECGQAIFQVGRADPAWSLVFEHTDSRKAPMSCRKVYAGAAEYQAAKGSVMEES